MNNKIIFLSIDRLGDYLIRSNVINKISKNYKLKAGEYVQKFMLKFEFD